MREEGPKSHLHKAHTPTSGGVAFIFAIVLVSFALSCRSIQFSASGWLVLAAACACGMLGFWDDLAKVMQRANKGLSMRLRLIAEAAIGLAFGIMFLYISPPALIWLPKSVASILAGPAGAVGGVGEVISLAIPSLLFCGLAIFLIMATANAVNLHDGMDGLAAGTAAFIFLTMASFFACTNQSGYAVIASIAAGSMGGFLLFNHYPARLFMGDTGSLFIGGLMAALCLAGGILYFFIPLALIYILETVSVIIQVTYFKLTKPYHPTKSMNNIELIWTKLTKKLPGEGKRIFRMAPLHHHFEAVLGESGTPEWLVVCGFWLVQLLLCLIVAGMFFIMASAN